MRVCICQTTVSGSHVELLKPLDIPAKSFHYSTALTTRTNHRSETTTAVLAGSASSQGREYFHANMVLINKKGQHVLQLQGPASTAASSAGIVP
jgi:hypothetical protein